MIIEHAGFLVSEHALCRKGEFRNNKGGSVLAQGLHRLINQSLLLDRQARLKAF